MLDFMGFATNIVMGLGLLLVIVMATRRNSLGTTLVLRRFSVDPASIENVVDIRGRPAGFVAWVLTTIGVDDETTLIVTRQRLNIRQAGLSGHHAHEVPLGQVASTASGYYQPVWAIILAVVSLAGGLLLGLAGRRGDRLSTIVGGLVLALVFAAIYALGRKIVLKFETTGGSQIGIAFRPSVIERVSVDAKQAEEALDVISKLIIASRY